MMLAVFGLALVAAAPVVLDDPLHVSPAALLATAHATEAPEGARVHVLLEENRIEVAKDGTWRELYREVYRVVSDSALEEWATFSTTWSPWQEERPVVRARVVTRDGTARDIDPATLSESEAGETSSGVFSDRRTLSGPLPAVAVGAVVVIEVESRGKRARWQIGEQRRWQLQGNEPVKLSRFELRTPRDTPVTTRVRGMSLTPTVSIEGELRITRFAAHDLPALTGLEPAAPGDAVQVPHIDVTTAPSWSAVATAFSGVVEPLLPMRKAHGPSGSARVAASQKIVDEVQALVRYTGLELGEAAVVPRAPKETEARRYGDCKDLAALVIARMREQGIAASLAVLRMGDGEDVAPDVPGMSSFDHAIVYAPGTPNLWIDVTEPHAVVGTTASSVQGRWALVVAPETRGLVRIPATVSSENVYRETRTFTLNHDGPAQVVESSEATGLVRAGVVSSFIDMSVDKTEAQLLRYARALYGARDLTAFEVSVHDKRAPARIRLAVDASDRGFTDAAQAELAIDPSVLFEWLPAFLRGVETSDDDGDADAALDGLAARVNDIALPLPYLAELKVRVAPPRGFRVRALPSDAFVRAGPATLTRSASVDKTGDVVIAMRFDAGDGRFSPREALELLRAVAAFRADAASPLVFDHEGALLLAEGKVREGLYVYRALIDSEPRAAVHHERLASKLIELGLGAAGRRVAQRAVEVEPGRASAYSALGWTLMHDELGRPLHAGFDREGALAAFETAQALAPSEPSNRLNIAVIHEHGPDGVRYGTGAQLDLAIAVYRKMRSELRTQAYDANLLVALFYAGHFAEVRAEALAMPRSNARDLLLIEATAALSGSAAALRDAAKLIPDGKRRREVLQSVSSDLLKLRRYQDAAAVLAAARIAGDVDRLRALRRYEETPLFTDARGAVQRVMIAALRDDAPAAQSLEGLTATRATSKGAVRSTTTAVERLRQTAAGFTAQGFTRPFLIDATFAAATWTVEGDDVGGRRVDVQTESATGATRERWFVVREEGRDVVLCAGPATAELAAEALRLIELGKIDAARRWLDWARDASDEEEHADELSAASLFQYLYTKGQPASVAELKLAAASAAILGPFGESAAPIVATAAGAASPALRPAYETALLRGALLRQDLGEARQRAMTLVAAHPQSIVAHRLLRAVCRGAKDPKCLVADAKAVVAEHPDDVDSVEILADARARAGDFAGAADLLRRVTSSGDASPHAVRLLAWLALFTQDDMGRAILHADQASTRAVRGDASSSLHTLAALYAETGRDADALATLGRALDDDAATSLREHDWYVVGRVAENWGLVDDARAAYERVAQPGDPSAVGTWALAARRLEALPQGGH